VPGRCWPGRVSTYPDEADVRGDRPLAVFPVTGPPGAGKTTALLSLDRRYPHLARFGVRDYGLRLAATGDSLGLAMRETLLRQELLSYELVLREFTHFLDHLPPGTRSVTVEGYPRDIRQCRDLMTAVEGRGGRVHAFVVVDLPDSVVRMRVADRWICVRCGLPTNEAIATGCRECGGGVTQRSDDSDVRLEQRLTDYRDVSRQVRTYFDKLDLLRVVDGLRPLEEVCEALAELLCAGHDPWQPPPIEWKD
jgi:adenylate kinase